MQRFSIRHILHVKDTELVRYVKQHQRREGGFDLEVDAWDDLSEEERHQIARRLK
jgi:hypothetical protein